jgi:hypothetical protein
LALKVYHTQQIISANKEMGISNKNNPGHKLLNSGLKV